MRTNIRPFLRFAAFFLVLALAVALANTCLIQTDTFVALMMDELKNSRDIELAIVGSSIVRDHFNACLLYTSPSPRDGLLSRMPSSA